MTPRAVLSALERVLVSAVLVTAVLGTTAWALTAPVVTSVLVGRYYDRASGLDEPVALRTAELVRRFVTDPGSPELPEEVAGRRAFDESASAHLIDVRSVLRAAGVAAGVAWAVFALWCVVAAVTRRASRIAALMWSGGLATIVVPFLAAAAGALDFGRFFAAFHGLFFQAGTWTFPPDSLLIELFPEPVWIALGLAWGTLTAACGVVLAAAAIPLRKKLDGASVPLTREVV